MYLGIFDLYSSYFNIAKNKCPLFSVFLFSLSQQSDYYVRACLAFSVFLILACLSWSGSMSTFLRILLYQMCYPYAGSNPTYFFTPPLTSHALPLYFCVSPLYSYVWPPISKLIHRALPARWLHSNDFAF